MQNTDASTQETQAIGQWLGHIFSEHQLGLASEQLNQYAQDLDGSHCLPAAIVWPESEQQVVQLLQLANVHGLALHPIARGRNWGYGTAKGSQAGQIIVDLSQMNQVLEINEELAYARLEPGVSQQDFYQALTASDSRLQLDITAGGKHTSVVGNILERGFGHTDYCDRFSNVLSMRVLLANGDIIETGMGCYQQSRAKSVYPYGIGPVLNGLFSQSNLGIVLEMTLALQPKPAYSLQLILMTRDPKAAPKMVAAIAKLKQEGIIASGVHTASMSRAFGEHSKTMQGSWVLTASLSGPKAVAKAKFAYAKKSLLAAIPQSRVILVNQTRFRLLNWLNQWLKMPAIRDLGLVLDLKQGRPTDQPLQTLLDDPGAHSQMQVHEFPANFRWICAVSSSLAEDIEQLLTTAESVFAEHGYEARFTLTNVSPRAVILIANIRFDKDPAACEQAKAFYQAIDQALLAQGFCPYRSGSGLYSGYRDALTPSHLELLQKLKHCLDPERLLSPGKYNLD